MIVCVAIALSALTAPPASASVAPGDTIRIEVGDAAVDGSVYRPHRARVRVHMDSTNTPPVNEWTNELTVGDSAGRRVARWVTLSQIDPATGNAGFDLRQTFDLTSMAPLGYSLTTKQGAHIRLALDGNRMRGTRRTPSDSSTQQVDRVIPRLGFIASASDLIPLAVGMKPGRVIIAPVWGPNMATAETRIFTVVGEVPIDVEGKTLKAWKVEERTEQARALAATWYLLDHSPYMVAGDVYLPNGRVQKMTEIELPAR